MKKTLLALLALSASTGLYAADEGLILEGVGILGPQRYAFVTYKNQSFRVSLNDNVDGWVVEKIQPRAIFVRNTHQKGADVLEINMDSVSVDPPVTPTVPPAPIPANRASTTASAPPKPNISPKTSAFKPRVINDEDIPPGHRRVRTPFGDVLVKDEQK